MNKLIKIFPFLPEQGNVGKLVLAILFYLIAPSVAGFIIGFILGLTLILIPLAGIVGLALTVYSIMGIVFAILKFTGKEF